MLADRHGIKETEMLLSYTIETEQHHSRDPRHRKNDLKEREGKKIAELNLFNFLSFYLCSYILMMIVC
jgi:hypothetical protein